MNLFFGGVLIGMTFVGFLEGSEPSFMAMWFGVGVMNIGAHFLGKENEE